MRLRVVSLCLHLRRICQTREMCIPIHDYFLVLLSIFHILLSPQFSISHQLFLSQPQNTIGGIRATFGHLLGVDTFFNYLKKN